MQDVVHPAADMQVLGDVVVLEGETVVAQEGFDVRGAAGGQVVQHDHVGAEVDEAT